MRKEDCNRLEYIQRAHCTSYPPSHLAIKNWTTPKLDLPILRLRDPCRNLKQLLNSLFTLHFSQLRIVVTRRHLKIVLTQHAAIPEDADITPRLHLHTLERFLLLVLSVSRLFNPGNQLKICLRITSIRFDPSISPRLFCMAKRGACACLVRSFCSSFTRRITWRHVSFSLLFIGMMFKTASRVRAIDIHHVGRPFSNPRLQEWPSSASFIVGDNCLVLFRVGDV